MSFWSRLKRSFTGEEVAGKQAYDYPVGVSQDEKDTLSVIRDLSRMVMNNPDSVDIYLALGNLFRSKGELEKAVQIRESLLVRPDLAPAFKARAYYELGQDYRLAGLMDRALNAYVEAERLGASRRQIGEELAKLYADSGDWTKAARYYADLGNAAAEAHYLTKQVQEGLEREPGEIKKALRGLNKALKVCPESAEAGAAMIALYARENKWRSASIILTRCLENIPPAKSFLLFEELFLFAESAFKGNDAGRHEFDRHMAEHFLPVLESRPPELFPYYYGALILKRCNRMEEANQWLSKALVIQPDFWSGRVAQLDAGRGQFSLPPALESDLEFFIRQSEKLKRFVCAACGLNRGQLFFCCPRCHSWHSAYYKLTVGE